MYLAVVAGRFPEDVRVIDKPVGGRRAVTHVEIRERLGGGATLVACRLETGRTHQIRIHMAEVGTPVIGDARYGRPWSPAPPRMALHATLLGLTHPRTGAALSFESPLPADLADMVGWNTVAQPRNSVTDPKGPASRHCVYWALRSGGVVGNRVRWVAWSLLNSGIEART